MSTDDNRHDSPSKGVKSHPEDDVKITSEVSESQEKSSPKAEPHSDDKSSPVTVYQTFVCDL
jgi:hypothetical protein